MIGLFLHESLGNRQMKNREIFIKKVFWILMICQFCLLFLIAANGCRQKDSEKLFIATAANMQYPMNDLVKAFSLQTGMDCETVISSSGILTAQIREGAPFDVFVSADMKYPAELYKDGYTIAAPEIYAYGVLILWTIVQELDPSIDLLTSDRIRHIALANPRTAPYGMAAVEVLERAGIYDMVQKKLVYGESISQTSQFIVSGAAEIGFTAKSVALSPDMEDRGNWIVVDENHYTPIAQGMVILKNKKIKQAEKFRDFLFSEKGRKILNKFGYLVHDK
jgi:molybdate transport system substrate-binding protein